MDFAALPGLFAEIRGRAESAAVPIAGALGTTYKKHLVDVTLLESGTHAGPSRTPAAEGRPPAFMPNGIHGSLRGSVTMEGPEGGGGWGESSVSPNTIYAVTQEYGGVHHAIRGPYMWLWRGFVSPAEIRRRGWLKETVTIPPRPYMSTAVKETIANGSLERAGESTFVAIVWG